VFAVLITGAPGAGKSECLMALSDMLVVDEIAHAVIDVDAVAWCYPWPSNAQRKALLAGAWQGHARGGHDLLLVAEVVESDDEVAEWLRVIEADDHILVVLEARVETLRRRIHDREPEGWSGLDYLVGETERFAAQLEELERGRLVLDTEELSPGEVAERIRAVRPDKLGG
jgi:RNase adaptor protein for sRNA GlmZ degradation